MRGLRRGGAYLSSMSFSRSTPSGRRIIATPRVQDEPDIDRLVALVLHLAEQLHHEEAQDLAIHARDDQTIGPGDDTGEVEEGHHNDTPNPRTS
ncbi:hypothetical protein G7067_02605 [Leucobacter insecticola]|uniref:Uncharacterized protein n=1 Tax=Leucobacter insecticola TaxID=2714934 RepID=A0A6G8FGN9_9MICO|nr:hypothetical protein [Leucobacter insecticola]QIM15551.1 hypothetical protein G7067_02605 [Leucobacter insecticola]